MSLSRRNLFGLLTGAAAMPLMSRLAPMDTVFSDPRLYGGGGAYYFRPRLFIDPSPSLWNGVVGKTPTNPGVQYLIGRKEAQ